MAANSTIMLALTVRPARWGPGRAAPGSPALCDLGVGASVWCCGGGVSGGDGGRPGAVAGRDRWCGPARGETQCGGRRRPPGCSPGAGGAPVRVDRRSDRCAPASRPRAADTRWPPPVCTHKQLCTAQLNTHTHARAHTTHTRTHTHMCASRPPIQNCNTVTEYAVSYKSVCVCCAHVSSGSVGPCVACVREGYREAQGVYWAPRRRGRGLDGWGSGAATTRHSQAAPPTARVGTGARCGDHAPCPSHTHVHRPWATAPGRSLKRRQTASWAPPPTPAGACTLTHAQHINK